jgi:hypothetical protein
MLFRPVLLLAAFSAVVSASDALIPFPDAAKSPQELARQMVNRRLEAYVTGTWQKEPPVLPRVPELPVARLRAAPNSNECAIPLLERKVSRAKPLKGEILKIPGNQFDRMTTPPPIPACKGRN